VFLLTYLEKFNFHYDKFSDIEIMDNRLRDTFLGFTSAVIILGIISVFAVMFIAPFMNGFPYDLTFTMKHFAEVFESKGLVAVYKNSLMIAFFSAVIGTLIAYSSAILNVRTSLKGRKSFDLVS